MSDATDTTSLGLAALRWGGCALRQLADSVLAVVLAPSCASCHELLERPTEGPVCGVCWTSILPLTPPLCARCADPLPTWRSISVPQACCPRCRRRVGSIARARTIGAYDGALRAIVHALKYDGRRSLAAKLAVLMRARGEDVLAGADWLVPVPLHPARRRARGFNQAADLARHMGLPVVGALRRIRATPSQTTLPAAQRHRNVRGAFAATTASRALPGSIVVLIDDVSTTGATLEACGRVLQDVGVSEVRALTAARVVTSRR